MTMTERYRCEPEDVQLMLLDGCDRAIFRFNHSTFQDELVIDLDDSEATVLKRMVGANEWEAMDDE